MSLRRKKIILSIGGIILLKLFPRFMVYCIVGRLTKMLIKNHNVFFRIEAPCLRGIKGFHFNKVYVRTDKYGIILKGGSFSIKPWHFIYKSSIRKIIDIIEFEEIFIQIIPAKYTKEVKPDSSSENRFCFEKRCYSIFRKSMRIFRQLHFNVNIQQMKIMLRIHNKIAYLFLHNISLIGNTINGFAEMHCENCQAKIPFELSYDADKGLFEIRNQAIGGSQKVLIERNNHSLSFTEYLIVFGESDNFSYTLSGEVLDLLVSSNSISATPILIRKVETEQWIRFTVNKFRILKESSIRFDGVSLFVEFYHCCSESDLLRMSTVLFIDGNDFLKNFPFFYLKNLNTMRAGGDVAVKFDYMTSLPDFSSYYFKAHLLQNSLKIEEKGDFDLAYLSKDFIHHLTDMEGNERKIIISKDNPKCLSLDQIPDHLKYAISVAEDPNFYDHRGLDSYFMGIAIAKNILNRKYVKGASTITMQLAKNLFLTSTRYVTRKIDEIILAWLIENVFHLSKNRILEIYINIIEFGENIYGLADAAQFYFGKAASDLDITESLVISYIIPRPKYFLEAVLMKSPKLVQRLANHIEFYSRYLLDKRIIDKELFSQIDYKIRFSASIGTLDLR